MKKRLAIVVLLMVFGLTIAATVQVKAQCSQCAATVETNSKNGGLAAKGLNKGIMFLLGAPYLAVGVVGFVWYKKYRRKNVDMHIHDEKLHLN
ncbi:MAG TPA: hypothetical protein VHA56_11355 [Mucilaginibacter sp.]|nr:hypothetical protein [Mucilaginibacter sp.]